MHSHILITLLICLLTIVVVTPMGMGNDHFEPNVPHCRGHGYFKDGKCHCYPRFNGTHCEEFIARECTKDKDCGTEYAYCFHKLTECRHSSHCKDPSGWCVPLSLP